MNELGANVGGEPAGLVSRIIRNERQLSDRVAAWREHWSERLAYELASRDDRPEPSIRDRVNSTVAVHVTGLILDEWLLRRRDHDLQLLTAEVIDMLRQDLAA